MALLGLFNRKNEVLPERLIYESIVAQARLPEFYIAWRVPDSLDGRFELLALHVFLVLNRLKGDSEVDAELPQRLHDLFFADMDESLREMGAGDLGVGKRVKRMVQGFYGRIAAYEEGLRDGEEVLKAAIRRNVFGTLSDVSEETVAKMAQYLILQKKYLSNQPTESLVAGTIAFAPPS